MGELSLGLSQECGMASATGVSSGGGEEAQKLCRKTESRAGEPCCQRSMDELESGQSWVQNSLTT